MLKLIYLSLKTIKNADLSVSCQLYLHFDTVPRHIPENLEYYNIVYVVIW